MAALHRRLMIHPRLRRFDRAATYVVRRGFVAGGRRFEPGELVRGEELPERVLFALYRFHKLDLAPAGASPEASPARGSRGAGGEPPADGPGAGGGEPPADGPAPGEPDWADAFLQAVRAGQSAGKAADAAGVARGKVYQRAKVDEAFAALWDEAKAAASALS